MILSSSDEDESDELELEELDEFDLLFLRLLELDIKLQLLTIFVLLSQSWIFGTTNKS